MGDLIQVATSLVYGWLAMLGVFTGFAALLMWRKTGSEEDSAASTLAFGIACTAIGNGIEDLYWMLSPFQQAIGLSDGWMRDTKQFLIPFGLLAITGYAIHQHAFWRALGKSTTAPWLVGAALAIPASVLCAAL